VLTDQKVSNPTTYGVIMFHLISGVAVLVVDVATLIITTLKLRTFQSNRADDEEKDEKAPLGSDGSVTKTRKRRKMEPTQNVWLKSMKLAWNDGKNETRSEDGESEDYDEHRPVTKKDRVLVICTLICHLIFTIDLCIIASTSPLNSGTVIAVVVIGLYFFTSIIYTWRSRSLTEVSESWLLNLRMFTILHLFALLLFFWIALCIVLLYSVGAGTGFVSTLQYINANSRVRGTLASLLIVGIFLSLATYGVILFVHSRSMWSLDEIASLHLAAKLQAKLKEDHET